MLSNDTSLARKRPSVHMDHQRAFNLLFPAGDDLWFHRPRIHQSWTRCGPAHTVQRFIINSEIVADLLKLVEGIESSSSNRARCRWISSRTARSDLFLVGARCAAAASCWQTIRLVSCFDCHTTMRPGNCVDRPFGSCGREG